MLADHTKLFFNAIDIEGLAGLDILDLSGMFAPGTRRADPDLIPGRQGRLGSPGPFDSFTFSIPVIVRGDSFVEMVTNLRAAGAALQGSGGLGQLKRWLPTGPTSHDVETAAGQFVAFNGLSLLTDVGETELTFVNLDGAWQTAGGAWVFP